MSRRAACPSSSPRWCSRNIISCSTPRELTGAIIVVLAFAAAIPLFALAPFSFGYMTGFYLYIMVAGYLWLNAFSEFAYNHTLTGLSAAASALAFLFPALFISSPLRQIYVLSPKALDRILVLILALSAATIAVGASYNFMFVDIENIYEYREKLEFPRAFSTCSGSPPTRCCRSPSPCSSSGAPSGARSLVLLLLVLFYPVTLTKTAFFAPAWLVVVLVVSRFFEPKTTITLTMLVPVAIGIVLLGLYSTGVISYRGGSILFQGGQSADDRHSVARHGLLQLLLCQARSDVFLPDQDR